MPFAGTLPGWLLALAALGAGAQEEDASRAVAAAAQATDIYLVDLEHGPDGVRAGPPRNASGRPGYDNQPFFLPDGKRFYYTAIHEDGQADIWRYDSTSGAAERVTRTAESEYSPTVPADGAGISTVRVERDGRQRLWRYGEDGTPGKPLVEGEESVGYHAWMDESTLALYVAGDPSLLKTVDLRSGREREVARDVGRCLQAIPARPGVAYLEAHADGARWIKLLQWPAGLTRLLTPPLEESEDFALGGDGELYMARDRTLYIWAREPGKWRVLADFAAELPGPITRLALSPRADLMALVVAEGQ